MWNFSCKILKIRKLNGKKVEKIYIFVNVFVTSLFLFIYNQFIIEYYWFLSSCMDYMQ